MNEERLFILKMIEQGKITAEEGAALLEALRDDGDERTDAVPDEEQGDHPDDQSADKDGEGPASDRGADGREQDQSDSGDRKSRPMDLGAQIREAIGAALKSVPSVTDELKENWKEVREDVRHSLHELRDEIKKKGLVDVSGLMELVNHMRDVGFGQSHEFHRQIDGTLTGSNPEVELLTNNGAVSVRGWDYPGYRLSITKRVHAADESRAKEIADELVEVEADDERLKARVRRMRHASVSMELWLPRKSAAAVEARSENGSIRFENLTCREVKATSTNGSVSLTGVTGDVVRARTTNGNISGAEVSGGRTEAKTTNGNVSWSGSAVSAELETVNGTVRVSPALDGYAPGEDGGGGRTSQYDVQTVNGTVHVTLPEDDSVGVQVKATARSVRVEGDESRLPLDGEGKGERRGRSPNYEQAERKLHFSARTVNGAIRIHAAKPAADSDKGGPADAGGENPDPENG